MPVYDFGCPADMKSLTQIAKDYDLEITEDAACALGASFKGQFVGTFGEIGCFSFHPRKSITTDEGGMFVTDDSDLANKLRLLRKFFE